MSGAKEPPIAFPPPPPQPFGLHELWPRYLFLEPLLKEARVLEVGAVSATAGRSAAFLRERGARFVLAVDADDQAVETAKREFASDPDLRFRAGSLDSLAESPFDLVLIADASTLLHKQSGFASLERVLPPSGHAMLALRNPSGVSLHQLAREELGGVVPTWGEMLAALKWRFTSVELMTQSAVVGYQLAPAQGEREPALEVDGTLQTSDECAYFLAICGERPSGLLGLQSLVVLPTAPLAVAALGRSELAERLRVAEQELAEARRKLAEAMPVK